MKEENHNPPKKRLSPIVIVNLIILACYTIWLKLSLGDNYSQNYGFILDAFFIGAQVMACLIVAIFTKPKEFLLSAGLVLAIGFSTCIMSATL